MQRFLQFRLSCSALPIVTGRYGSQYVARTDRICSHCGPGSFADELHVVHECPETDTMRPFFAQRDHMQVFKFIDHYSS